MHKGDESDADEGIDNNNKNSKYDADQFFTTPKI